MTPNQTRALWAVGIVTATAAGVGILAATSSAAHASTRKDLPPPVTWRPVPLTRDNVNPLFSGYVLTPGTYRIAVDSLAGIDANSPEYTALLNFAQSIPAQQDNDLVTYAAPPENLPLPADWPTSDVGKPGRVRSQFVIPDGAPTARIPDAFNDQIWKKTT